MLEFVKNINVFWKDDLSKHSYVRKVNFTAENLNHLDKNFYNKQDFLLQSFNEELPVSQNFKDTLNVKFGSVSWTCILPNTILPTHTDSFFTLRKEFNIEIDKCFRYLIFLEDWKFGHYVGFKNKNITHWTAGDVWKFNFQETHYAVNASNELFHTCQVSSFN